MCGEQIYKDKRQYDNTIDTYKRYKDKDTRQYDKTTIDTDIDIGIPP